MSEEKKNLSEEERKELKEKLKKQIDEMTDDELEKVAGGIGSLETLYNWLETRGYITEGLRLANEAKEKGGKPRKTFVAYILEVLDTKAPDEIKYLNIYANAIYDII